MRTILIDVVLPLALAAILLSVRGKYGVRVYAAVSVMLAAAAFGVWASTNDIFYYYLAPLAAGGFHSWAVPAAVLSAVTICMFPFRRYWKLLQGILTFLFANVFFLLAGWVA
jgi:hypothetical protein